jgi:nucleoside-diphosphate-sugar epimerase
VLQQALLGGHEVHALRRTKSLPKIPIAGSPQWHEGQLTDDWTEQLCETDVLIHLAACGVSEGADDWTSCFKVNVLDSLQLWRQAVKHGVSRFIICGSCFEYGKSGTRYNKIPPDAPLWPTTAYAASKASATMAALALAETHSLNLVVVRPFHVYGPGEDQNRFWPGLVHAANSGIDYAATGGEQLRDFTPVLAAADYILTLAVQTDFQDQCIISPTVVNLGSGQPSSLREFADKEWKRLGGRGSIMYGSIPYRFNEVMSYVPDLSFVYNESPRQHQ